MAKNVGIRLRQAGRIELTDANGLDLQPGQSIVVEGPKGIDLAKVIFDVDLQPERFPVGTPTRLAQRIASEEDMRKQTFFIAKEPEALHSCREKVLQHQLPMKVLLAEYTFDGSRLTFYFTAEGRVDFRMLVRDLAGTFRTRIELRQVGPRDETKLLGGLGRCGRPICCTAWLRDFTPVSMRMAKNQDLPLTDSRLAGICGRLMCCLAFENQAYAEAKHRPPCAVGGVCGRGLRHDDNSATDCPHIEECLTYPVR